MEQHKVLDLVKKFESQNVYPKEEPIDTKVNDSSKKQIGAIGKDRLLHIRAKLKNGLGFLDDETKVKVNPSVNMRWFGGSSQQNTYNKKRDLKSSRKSARMSNRGNKKDGISSEGDDTSNCNEDDCDYLSSVASMFSLSGDKDSELLEEDIFLSATDVEATDDTIKSSNSSNNAEDNQQQFELETNNVMQLSGLETITEAFLFKGIECGDSSKLKPECVNFETQEDETSVAVSNDVEELFNEIYLSNIEETDDLNDKFMEMFDDTFSNDLEQIDSNIEIFNTTTSSLLS